MQLGGLITHGVDALGWISQNVEVVIDRMAVWYVSYLSTSNIYALNIYSLYLQIACDAQHLVF